MLPAFAELLRHLAEVRRARILGPVDAVAEAGDLLLARELVLHVRVDAFGGRVLADLEQHLHDVLVRAAVQRALQRADAGDVAECMSASVAAVTRAANVLALSSCSA